MKRVNGCCLPNKPPPLYKEFDCRTCGKKIPFVTIEKFLLRIEQHEFRYIIQEANQVRGGGDWKENF